MENNERLTKMFDDFLYECELKEIKMRDYRRNYYREYLKDPEKREKHLARMRKYYERNRDRINQNMKDYYLKRRVEKMNQLINDL